MAPSESGWYEIFTALRDDDCSEVLDTVIHHMSDEMSGELLSGVNDALVECADSNPEKAVRILESLIRSQARYTIICRGLEAVGQASIEQVNALLLDLLQEDCLPPQEYIPHLYRDKEGELAEQFQNWCRINKWYFRDAASVVLQYALKLPPGAPDHRAPFEVDVEPIFDSLVNLANSQGLDASDVNGAGDSMILRGHMLIEDVVHRTSFAWQEIETNLDQYESIADFLQPVDWKTRLQTHNRHPLVTNLQDTKYRHVHDQLCQLDYCLSFIRRSSDPISSLRSRLLNRHQYNDTLTELLVIAILRRKFGTASVEIDAPIPDSDKDTDTKISTDDYNLRIEVTSPKQDDMLQIGGATVRTMNPDENPAQTNPARGPVTRKARGQIAAAKEHTDDICAIALQKRLFGVSDSDVQNYVLGQEVVFLKNGELGVARMEDQIFADDSASNVDYLIVFGPSRSDVNLSDLSSDLYVLHGENTNATSGLESAFDAEVHYHSDA